MPLSDLKEINNKIYLLDLIKLFKYLRIEALRLEKTT